MAITPKERELAAVGIPVAAGCKPCTDHHVEVARKAGASDQEIKEAVVVALAVRKSAAEMMAGYDDILDAVCDAWNKLVRQPERIRSLTAADWVLSVKT